MLIYLDIMIPHLQIAHQGGNLEVGNIKIHQLEYSQQLIALALQLTLQQAATTSGYGW